MLLKDKIIWLVGASEGIGYALLKQLHQQGARIVLTARNERRLNDIAQELGNKNLLVATADVMQLDTLQSAYTAIISQWGVPDIVIYNAGVYTPMPLEQWSLDQAIVTMDVNTLGAMRLVDVVLPDMKKNQVGHIVMVSSVAAYRGLPDSAAYGASKAALSNFTEYLKIEGSKYHIKVQLVSPGFVKTRLTEQNNFSMPAMISAEQAAQRILSGLHQGQYEIHFPKRFTFVFKLLRILPHSVYFWMVQKITL